MKEQSHKSEMRAALRGDFERLRARRQETVEPVLPPVEAVLAPVESVPPAVDAVEPQVAPVVAEARVSRPSWLDRLRDRG